jgi:hypothetical protein
LRAIGRGNQRRMRPGARARQRWMTSPTGGKPSREGHVAKRRRQENCTPAWDRRLSTGRPSICGPACGDSLGRRDPRKRASAKVACKS